MKTDKQYYIYIISNPVFTGWLKIGRTDNITERLRSYQTGDPLRKYKLEYILPVNNPPRFEKFFKQYGRSEGEWTQLCLSDCIDIITKIKEQEDIRFVDQTIFIDGVEFPVRSYITTKKR